MNLNVNYTAYYMNKKVVLTESNLLRAKSTIGGEIVPYFKQYI